MAQVSFYKINNSQLNSVSIAEGQVIFVQDTGELYIDKDSSNRVKVSGSSLEHWLDGTASGSARTSDAMAEENGYSLGESAIAEGHETLAPGSGAHAEGIGTVALDAAHAEGAMALALGAASHAEGANQAVGTASLSGAANSTIYTTSTNFQEASPEFIVNTDNGIIAKVVNYTRESNITTITLDRTLSEDTALNNQLCVLFRDAAFGAYSHSEGFNTSAGIYDGNNEGLNSIGAHSEGYITKTCGSGAHSEGYGTMAYNIGTHSEGRLSLATGAAAHAEGYQTAIGNAITLTLTGDEDATTYTFDETISASDRIKCQILLYKNDEYSPYFCVRIINMDLNNKTITVDHTVSSSGAISHKQFYVVQDGAIGTGSHIEGRITLAYGDYSHAEGYENIADGVGSHAEGNNTVADGNSSHAEGWDTQAIGNSSHAEGAHSIALGVEGHAEGLTTIAKGDYSHAEGNTVVSYGTGSHAEGYCRIYDEEYSFSGAANATTYTISFDAEDVDFPEVGDIIINDNTVVAITAVDWTNMTVTVNRTLSNTALNDQQLDVIRSGLAYGNYSHVEGMDNKASGEASHAEGNQNEAIGDYSHAEGLGNWATGEGAHAEGYGNGAEGNYSHAEGYGSYATGTASHAEGEASASGYDSHGEGQFARATGNYSHAEGVRSQASGVAAHAEGNETRATGNYSHSEGDSTIAYGDNSHAEGRFGIASGIYSHVEGYHNSYDNINLTGAANSTTYTYTVGANVSVKVGKVIMYSYDLVAKITSISGNTVTVNRTLNPNENFSNKGLRLYKSGAAGAYSHAEGDGTFAFGDRSHAEGIWTVAEHNYSHAEGAYTSALGQTAHAEGQYTIAKGTISHAEGLYTIARNYQHVQGQYNIEDTNQNYAHIIGNGTAENARSNAHTIDWQGNAWFAGDVRVGGTSYDNANVLLAGAASSTNLGGLKVRYDDETQTLYIRNDGEEA